jgi:hypothetical protein
MVSSCVAGDDDTSRQRDHLGALENSTVMRFVSNVVRDPNLGQVCNAGRTHRMCRYKSTSAIQEVDRLLRRFTGPIRS